MEYGVLNFPLFTTHYPLFTIHYPLFPIHYPLFPIPYPLSPIPKAIAITERNSTRDRLQLFIDIYKD